jgi:hypothetical protein
MEKFNNCLVEFLKVIYNNYPNQIDNINKIYKYENEEEKVNLKLKDIETHLDSFLKNCNGKGDDISSKNEIIFTKDTILLDGINFYEIWNDEKLDDKHRENIWKYLHSLYLHAYEYHSEKDFRSLLKDLKKLSKSKDQELSEEERTFLNIIECLTIERKVEKNKDKNDSDNDDNEESSGGFNINDIKDTFESMQNELFEGQIGTLAKEIADEIDINKLKLDNPMSILKSVVNGSFDENNDESGVSSLVKNISNKVQSKLASGELDENKLYEEAKTVINKFSKLTGQSKGKGKGGNPMATMLNKMMKKAETGEQMDEDELMNMAKSMLPKNMMSAMSTRDRLKKKLEEKKNKKNK